MIIEEEKNQSKKTSLNLEKLVLPLESKINPYIVEKFINNN